MQSDHGNPVGHWSESSKLRSWFERLEVVFMDLEDENSNDKWKAVKLIKWIGPEGYERLKMLCAPNLPIEEPYTTLKELLLRITRYCESIVNYQLRPSNPGGNGLQKKKYDNLMGLCDINKAKAANYAVNKK